MKARDIKCGYQLTRGGSNKEEASQTLRLLKNGGTAGDDDQQGLGWPPWELALLFILPEHQSTIVPPLLCKARGKRKKGRKQHQRNKDPKKREKLNSMPSRCLLTKKKSNKAPNQKASHLFTHSHMHSTQHPFQLYNIANNQENKSQPKIDQ